MYMDAEDRKMMLEKMVLVADNIKKETSVLKELLDYPEDSANISKRISSYEDRCDDIKHEIGYYVINHSNLIVDPMFHHLFDLCDALENLTDMLDDLGKVFVRLNVNKIREDYPESILNLQKSAEVVIELVNALKSADTKKSYIGMIIELNHLKDENSEFYDNQMKKLFSGSEETLEVIRWNEIYSLTVKASEAFELVADTAQRYQFLSGEKQ